MWQYKMAFTNWTNSGSNIQGDLNMHLEMGRVYQKFVELNLFSFSSKWDKFDIAIEYRKNKNEQWYNDAKLILTDCDYIKGNKLFGLKALSVGYLSKIIWNYSQNHIKMGDNVETRILILPRIKQFSKSSNVSLETVSYGNNKVDFISKTSNYNILGINNYGQYIASSAVRLYIFNSFNSAYVYYYGGVLNPKHAIQIYSDEYIVADTGNNRVLWLDATFSNVLRTYSVSSPQFIDYSESNETLLITGRNPDEISEVIWSKNEPASILWTSSIGLNNPSSANYSKYNSDKLIISDTGNNRVVEFNKFNSTYDSYKEFLIRDGYNGFNDVVGINKPFRSYQFNDGNVCIIEESGKEIDFAVVETSSSSSSELYSTSSSSEVGI